MEIVTPEIQRGEIICCVYKFVLDTGHFYIGGTQNLSKRIYAHCRMFATEECNFLVRKYIKNASKVSFEIIERVATGDEKTRENFYLKKEWGNPLLLNRAKDAVLGGIERMEWEIELFRKAATGKVFSKERRENISKANKRRCKENPSSFEKFSAYGKSLRKKVVVYNLAGEYIGLYDSYRDASAKLNVDLRKIQLTVKGVQKKAAGYIFRGVDANGNIIQPSGLKRFKQVGINNQVIVTTYDLLGNLVNTYKSIKDAGIDTGVHIRTIHKIFIGTQKTSKGLIFKRDRQ